MAANPHGHGHNYVVDITLEGDPDPVTGMVLDLKKLKDVVNREVITSYDHRFLNYEVPPFDREVPTTENIARDIWRRLEPRFPDDSKKLHAVRVYETPDLYVDYFGEPLSAGPPTAESQRKHQPSVPRESAAVNVSGASPCSS